MGIDKVVLLPLYLQVMLGCGYLGYLIARQGYRGRDQVADQVLGAIAFGLPALPAWFLVVDMSHNVIAAGFAAFVFCILFAILWRIWLSDEWARFVRKAQISNDDGRGYVWDYLIHNTTLCPTQITVYLKNGERLHCSDTYPFKESALGAPVTCDAGGSIAFYVTHEWKEGAWKAQEDISVADWGDLLTYVPASEIARIEMRHVDLSRPLA